MTASTDRDILVTESSVIDKDRTPSVHVREQETHTLLHTFTHLVARRKLLYQLLSVAMVLATVHWLVFPRRYTAQAVLTPEADIQSLPTSSSLVGLAARFGVSDRLGMTPLSFYSQLIGTEGFLNKLVLAPLTLVQSADTSSVAAQSTQPTVRLIDLYSRPEDSLPFRLRKARRKVWNNTTAAVSQDANTVTLEFTANDPQLAAATANAYVAFINEFNVTQRRSQAKALREFLERDAIPRAGRELQASEDSLAAFYGRNRSFETSPMLRLQEARLQRRISLKQENYVTLEAELERSRVEEIRDTPVVTVVSPALAPAKPSSPLLYIDLPVAVLLAIATWLVWVLFEEYATFLLREDPRAVAALKAELQGATSRGRRGTAAESSVQRS